MDTKSLAKSKRAHTLHQKKHHPNQKVRAAATPSLPPGADKAPGKEKPRVALPSNWDRYEDEDNLIIMENQTDGQPSDAVVPKSKGADYAFLISEAKAQTSTRLSSEFFPTLDDFDFGQGKESFVAVRGESLLSSIQNDSFFVEDKTPANYEASFLSLNMHALANQLTKLDLPKRLFMEPDFFPTMQHSEKVQEHQSYDHHEVTSSATTKSDFDTNPTVHQQPTPKRNPKPVSNQSKLKAETAEIELDTLLDSFDDVNSKEKVPASTLTSKDTALDFDIDSTLDDLLNETSAPSLLDPNNIASQTQHVSNSEPLDDFDSWFDTI
ncbi:protein ECERIFERUM 16-like isoform X2 [Bidens hawaiensis]|uniref:protein ECERIFERUM 16-like isoform X2 n=1 Tax=Bidens hawaiensis TaxID=980011 RepID=UPI00404A689B